MKWMVIAIGVFTSSAGMAATLPAECGSHDEIRASIASHEEYYSDVRLALDCDRASDPASELVCGHEQLYDMYRLETMASAYAWENASKVPVDHDHFDSRYVSKCETVECVCAEFASSTNDSLGGESPYYHR